MMKKLLTLFSLCAVILGSVCVEAANYGSPYTKYTSYMNPQKGESGQCLNSPTESYNSYLYKDFSSNGLEFNSVEYIGRICGNGRTGGPSPVSCDGYKSKNENSLSFGNASDDIKFEFKNKVSSVYKGKPNWGTEYLAAVLGDQKFDGVSGNIYKIVANDGRKVYVLHGYRALSQDFILLAQYKNGKWGSIRMNQLKQYHPTLEYIDSGESLSLCQPVVKGNTIILPYKRPGKNGRHVGEFRFRYSDDAGWFGIEDVVY